MTQQIFTLWIALNKISYLIVAEVLARLGAYLEILFQIYLDC